MCCRTERGTLHETASFSGTLKAALSLLLALCFAFGGVLSAHAAENTIEQVIIYFDRGSVTAYKVDVRGCDNAIYGSEKKKAQVDKNTTLPYYMLSGNIRNCVAVDMSYYMWVENGKPSSAKYRGYARVNGNTWNAGDLTNDFDIIVSNGSYDYPNEIRVAFRNPVMLDAISCEPARAKQHSFSASVSMTVDALYFATEKAATAYASSIGLSVSGSSSVSGSNSLGFNNIENSTSSSKAAGSLEQVKLPLDRGYVTGYKVTVPDYSDYQNYSSKTKKGQVNKNYTTYYIELYGLIRECVGVDMSFCMWEDSGKSSSTKYRGYARINGSSWQAGDRTTDFDVAVSSDYYDYPNELTMVFASPVTLDAVSCEPARAKEHSSSYTFSLSVTALYFATEEAARSYMRSVGLNAA